MARQRRKRKGHTFKRQPSGIVEEMPEESNSSKECLSEQQNDGSGEELEYERADVSGRGDELEYGEADVSGRGDELEYGEADVSGRGDELEYGEADVSGRGDELEYGEADVSGSGDELEYGEADVSGSGDELDCEEADMSVSRVQLEHGKDNERWKEDVLIINVLQPSKLMMMNIEIKGEMVKGMIDSGSTYSFTSSEVAKRLGLNVQRMVTKEVNSYGGHVLTTIGMTKVELVIGRLVIEVELQVLENKVAYNYEVILGLDFLKYNGVELDLEERKIEVRGQGSSYAAVGIDSDGKGEQSIYSNLPVYAAEEMAVGSGERVWIKFAVPNLKLSAQEHYFEGCEEKTMNCSGIVSEDVEKILCENRSKKKKKIKKGEQLGMISLLIDEDEKLEEEESWSWQKLKEAVRLKDGRLSDNNKGEVLEMLMRVNKALSKGDGDVGRIKVEPHKIELKEHKPIWQKPRSFAEPVNQEIENQCKELLSENIIEHSNSNWSSPCVPVRKPDGTLRLCIDYRKLNHVTIPEKFPMPNINNYLYKPQQIQYFTKLDLVRGYYQVELEENSKAYTAFSTPNNHFQFKRLPFGLKNSGIHFQKTMQEVLAPLQGNLVLIYIDDILIMSRTYQEHLELVEKVLILLEKYGIKIKLKKCEFFVEQVNFLGHILGASGIKKSPEFVEKVINFKRPETVTDMRKFLGLVNFQRKFIQNCSQIAKPLTEVTGGAKKAKIDWTEERVKAFDGLKEEIGKEVELSYPEYGVGARKLELFVDASGIGVGACLQQEQDGEMRIIGFGSMCFSKTQKRYSTIERELTAIRWGCENFKPFIFGVEFVLFTDHKPLIYMHNMAPHSSRVQRTLEELSEFNFIIKYLPGVDNVAADVLSRMKEEDIVDDEDYEELMEEFRVIEKVDGGGDSLFEAVWICIKDLGRKDWDLPKDHLELREKVVQELKINNKKYEGVTLDKSRIKILARKGQFSPESVLLVVSLLYEVEIRVYHNIKIPVVYDALPEVEKPIIHLQCLAFIHYNPIYTRKENCLERNERILNTVKEPEVEECPDVADEEVEVHYLYEEDKKECCHRDFDGWGLVRYNGHGVCVLVDTGAQVSLIAESVWEKVRKGNEVEEGRGDWRLAGMEGHPAECLKIVWIELDLGDGILEGFPFAVVGDGNLPCCMLIGLNFLKRFRARLNFRSGMVHFCEGGDLKFGVNNGDDGCGWSLRLDVDSGSDDNILEEVGKVQFQLEGSKLSTLQSSNHAIKLLRTKIESNIPTSEWKEVALGQFKRYRDLQVVEGIVVKVEKASPAVVPFKFMVELLFKIHAVLGHLGRQKLVEIIRRQFWHPGMDNVAREICKACDYCQKNKVNVLNEKPPILKLQSSRPFELVAIDVMRLPTSSSGYIGLLVAVDHFTKWMNAIPIKNKSASTISKALKYQILPNLVQVPQKILSDNGLEFRGKETEEVLEELGIEHVYSSPYHPQGNGAVERTNQTITSIIRALTDDIIHWDKCLSKAIITYNSTYHSHIKASPAEFIVKNSHATANQIPIPSDLQETWKEGNPNFKSFRVGDKVIKEVVRSGERAVYK